MTESNYYDGEHLDADDVWRKIKIQKGSLIDLALNDREGTSNIQRRIKKVYRKLPV